MSGGGSTQTDGTPQYLKQAHQTFLVSPSAIFGGIPLDATIDTASGINPYRLLWGEIPAVSATQAQLEGRLAQLRTNIDEFVAPTVWNTLWGTLAPNINLVKDRLGVPSASQLKDTFLAFSAQSKVDATDLATLLRNKTAPTGQWNLMIGDVVTKVLTAASNMMTSVKAGVSDEVNAQMDVAATAGLQKMSAGIAPATNQALTRAGNAENAAQTEAAADLATMVSTIFADAIVKVNAGMDAAFAKAGEGVNATVVDDLVDAFEDSSEDQYLRGVAKFAGGMVDINAVNSTAFIIGMSLQERGRSQEINAFRKEFVSKLYMETLPLYIQSFQQTFSTYLQGYLAEIESYLQTYRQHTEGFMKAFYETTYEHLHTYLARLEQNITTWTKNLSESFGTVNAGSSLIAQRAGQVYDTHAQSYMQGKTTEREAVQAYINQSLASMLQAEVQERLLRLDYMKLHKDIKVGNIELGRERHQGKLESKVGEQMWKLNMYKHFANAIAALGGATSYTEDKPSELSTIMGGALSGAAAGSAIAPGVGTGVGALLGGLAG